MTWIVEECFDDVVRVVGYGFAGSVCPMLIIIINMKKQQDIYVYLTNFRCPVSVRLHLRRKNIT